MNRFSQISLAPVWVTMASIMLSLCWILPNHSQPWTSFHSDAWAAVIFLAVGLVVFFKAKLSNTWHGLPLIVAVLIPLPFVQHFAGILPFSGQAWISASYLLGFLLALLLGQQWQIWRPIRLGDFLFVAIGMASVVSVTLQLQQWLGLTDDGMLDVWVRASNGGRPFANMGQPNQLATLLIWGLLACGWGAWRRWFGMVGVIFISTFLLFGLALTQSRTAFLGILTLVLFAWWWRNLWGMRNVIWLLFGLLFFYIFVLIALGPTERFLMLNGPASMLQRFGHESRPELWKMLLDAAWRQPWLGYGWNQVLPAQLAVADRYMALSIPFMQSHNLFLDFVLWNGIPLGSFLTGCVLVWVVAVARRVSDPQDALYFLLVLVVGIHAMLELPLHYAYFLLPVGLIMGALNAKLNIGPCKFPSKIAGRWLTFVLWVCAAILLMIFSGDYYRAERAYSSLRLQKAGISNSQIAAPPVVILLTNLRETQRFMQFEPVIGASAAELQWAKEVVGIWPSSRNFITLSAMLGLSDRPEEAHDWLVKICLIVPRDQCVSAPSKWENTQRIFPQLIAVKWPVQN